MACLVRRPGVRPSHLLLAAAALLAATPATAQSVNSAVPAPAAGTPAPAASRWALPAANLGKRMAVLGGQSAMAQILTAQGSAVQTAAAAASVGAASLSYARAADVVASGSPNVFGTIALAVSATPLDAQWRRAGGQAAWRPARWAGGFRTDAAADRETLLRDVNRWVNGRIAFTDDIRLSGQADRWSGAAETLRRGRGDCEDYALAKMQILRALGFDSDEMYLVVVRDLVRRADHAVLVVELDGRYVVLDNMTDEVLDSNQVDDYRPVMSYSSAGRWIHGYAVRRERAPIQVAATTTGYAAP